MVGLSGGFSVLGRLVYSRGTAMCACPDVYFSCHHPVVFDETLARRAGFKIVDLGVSI
jgi:hypothetical protein